MHLEVAVVFWLLCETFIYVTNTAISSSQDKGHPTSAMGAYMSNYKYLY